MFMRKVNILDRNFVWLQIKINIYSWTFFDFLLGQMPQVSSESGWRLKTWGSLWWLKKRAQFLSSVEWCCHYINLRKSRMKATQNIHIKQINFLNVNIERNHQWFFLWEENETHVLWHQIDACSRASLGKMKPIVFWNHTNFKSHLIPLNDCILRTAKGCFAVKVQQASQVW